MKRTTLALALGILIAGTVVAVVALAALSSSPAPTPTPEPTPLPPTQALQTAVPATPTTPATPPSPSPTARATPSPLLPAAELRSMGGAGPLDNLSPDGFTWAQAFPLQADAHGRLIALAQDSDSLNVDFVYSNDGGLTWASTDLGEFALTRGAFALDTRNDVAHVLWRAQTVDDGMLYRRYAILRDAADNIVGFERDAAVNLQLDAGATRYEHPLIFWLDDAVYGAHGALLAIWGAYDTEGTPNTWEVRASLRVLSSSADDNAAGNWRAPVTVGATTMTQAPAVPYSIVAGGVDANVVYPSALRLASGAYAHDVWVFWAQDRLSSPIQGRRLRWNAAASDWSSGLSDTITLLDGIARAGSDTGYGLKYQLLSKPVHDAARDRVCLGFASWKDDRAGDTWSFRCVDGAGALGPLVDVYSAGGAHSFAPTGDIALDPLSGYLLVSYIATSTQYVYLQLFDGTTAVLDALLAGAIDADIPLLYTGPVGATQGLIILTRDHDGTPPYQGYVMLFDEVGA